MSEAKVVRLTGTKRSRVSRSLRIFSLPLDVQDATPATASQTPAKDRDTLRLEEVMSELIGSPFSNDQPGGKVTIVYAGRMDVLEGLLQCLGYDPDQG